MRSGASATTESSPTVTTTSPSRASTTACPTFSARSGSRRSSASRSSSQRASASPAWYTERLEHLVLTPRAAEGDRHGWQAYVVQLDRRDEALHSLRAEGIEVQIGTYALHHLGAYRDQGPFPGADRAFRRALALPFATTMTEAECDRVAQALAASSDANAEGT